MATAKPKITHLPDEARSLTNSRSSAIAISRTGNGTVIVAVVVVVKYGLSIEIWAAQR
jgi:hypothetical protein